MSLPLETKSNGYRKREKRIKYQHCPWYEISVRRELITSWITSVDSGLSTTLVNVLKSMRTRNLSLTRYYLIVECFNDSSVNGILSIEI